MTEMLQVPSQNMKVYDLSVLPIKLLKFRLGLVSRLKDRSITQSEILWAWLNLENHTGHLSWNFVILQFPSLFLYLITHLIFILLQFAIWKFLNHNHERIHMSLHSGCFFECLLFCNFLSLFLDLMTHLIIIILQFAI